MAQKSISIIYTNITIFTLFQIQYVKDLTVLPYIKNSDWKEDCHIVIREYFENPAFALLSIHFEINTLKVQLSVPKGSQSDFVYFLRTPWHVFTVNNFHATVVFGSINHNAMMCVMKVMENMYVPVALYSKDWPESIYKIWSKGGHKKLLQYAIKVIFLTKTVIRNNLLFNLHNFLMCLTEWVYKPMGLVKLYVPRENLSDIVTLLRNQKFDLSEENEKQDIFKDLMVSKKALIERFERIVRYWTKQIREVFASTFTNKTGRTMSEELQHWTAIYRKLYCLHDQLSSKEIQLILRLLENVCSPSIDFFQILTLQLHEGLERAVSNVTYLNVLMKACNDLKYAIKIEEHMIKIFFLILFIWTESSFYKKSYKRRLVSRIYFRSNIKILCEAMSIEVVHQCKSYVNLEALLEGDAKNGINTLLKCISFCQTYKTAYDKVSQLKKKPDLVTVIGQTAIVVNAQVVSEQMDLDKAHNRKTEYYGNPIVVEAIRQTYDGRCNKAGMIGGTKGSIYETYCHRIENLFYKNLDEIKLVRNNILDIAKCTWLKNMQTFRDSMAELENMVNNLIECIFKEVKNIEEGIEAIYTLQRFKHRETLRDTLSMKWIQVRKKFVVRTKM
ncbi:dynein axonemal heavy chain 2-like [Linepithema humile]|uniref:dynein axonemal heavy chain 2-like n=1 Tax=Linepithema humile TaxID=83485 RepID=UPI00351DC384